jgi:diaminopimelate decarboxylase
MLDKDMERVGGVRDESGTLLLGGARADRLAKEFGTPLLVIDTDLFRAKIRALEEAAAPYGIDVAYAGKALLLVALAEILRETTLTLDVCSLGELLTAQAARFQADRLRLHGCGKTDDELRAAIGGAVGKIVVDNVEELDRLIELGGGSCAASILLRCNTGIEAHTHDYVRTGGEHTKFGLSPHDAAVAIERCRAAALRLAGFHSHIGSQIFERKPFVANLEALFERFLAARSAGIPVEELVVGGGFGVGSETEGEPEFDPADVVRTLGKHAAELAQAARVPAPALGIEPGRALIAEAGTSLYRVLSVKSQGARRFVIIDGGVADNPRPMLYGAYHHPLAVANAGRTLAPATICGRSCENDVVVQAYLPDGLRRGDLVALCATGAYTYSMASNYNRFPRPAVVFAGGGGARIAAARESDEDVLRLDAR